jgi:hypothetical protein
MTLFHRVQFEKPDPLDDGTADEIDKQKNEGAINLHDDDTQGIVAFWEDVSKSFKKEQK